jgi:hypothetical protein
VNRPSTPGPRPSAGFEKGTTGSVWAVGRGHLAVSKIGPDCAAASIHDENGEANEVVFYDRASLERMRWYVRAVLSVLDLPEAP